jgi:putative transposase
MASSSNFDKGLDQGAAIRQPHLNNRAENSHLPFRRRERVMQGFRSPRYLQRFVNVFSAVRNLFVPPRSNRSAPATHLHRLNAMAEWKAVANIA